MTDNAAELYETGQDWVAKAMAMCQEYAERSDEICRSCAESATRAAEEAKAAHGEVSDERKILVDELQRYETVNKTLSEVVNFLLQCSDLSQTKRDEAEAIIRKGLEVY